jgi:hypothetical protein
MERKYQREKGKSNGMDMVTDAWAEAACHAKTFLKMGLSKKDLIII